MYSIKKVAALMAFIGVAACSKQQDAPITDKTADAKPAIEAPAAAKVPATTEKVPRQKAIDEVIEAVWATNFASKYSKDEQEKAKEQIRACAIKNIEFFKDEEILNVSKWMKLSEKDPVQLTGDEKAEIFKNKDMVKIFMEKVFDAKNCSTGKSGNAEKEEQGQPEKNLDVSQQLDFKGTKLGDSVEAVTANKAVNRDELNPKLVKEDSPFDKFLKPEEVNVGTYYPSATIQYGNDYWSKSKFLFVDNQLTAIVLFSKVNDGELKNVSDGLMQKYGQQPSNKSLTDFGDCADVGKGFELTNAYVFRNSKDQQSLIIGRILRINGQMSNPEGALVAMCSKGLMTKYSESTQKLVQKLQSLAEEEKRKKAENAKSNL